MGITNPVLTCSPSIERHHLVMQSAHLPHEAQSIRPLSNNMCQQQCQN